MVMMAAKNLWKRKLRTLLTVLGVVIGTASIVVMMSIGIGLNESYTKELEQWGSLQIIEVYNYNWDNSGGDIKLDDKAVESFEAIEGVEAVAPMVETYGLIAANNRFVSDVSIRGMDPSLMEEFGYTVSEGRLLQEGDKMQVVLGAYTKENFRNPKLSWQASMNAGPPEVDLFGDRMVFTTDYSYGTKYADSSVKAQRIEVVGVMDGSNQNAYYTVMPIDQVIKIKEEQERRNQGNYGGSSSQKKDKYSTILVKVDNTDNVMDVQQAIKDMGYTAYSLADSLESINEMTNIKARSWCYRSGFYACCGYQYIKHNDNGYLRKNQGNRYYESNRCQGNGYRKVIPYRGGIYRLLRRGCRYSYKLSDILRHKLCYKGIGPECL